MSGGLSHRLRTNAADHLTGVNDSSLEVLLDGADELVEGGLVEPVLLDDLF